MRFQTNTAVTAAADSARDSEIAAVIEALNRVDIVEREIGPVLKRLIQRWVNAGSPPDTAHPTLHPILILESVRVAEAINRLEFLLPGTQPVLDLLLPLLTQAILEAGSMKIDNNGLLKLVRAAGLLKAIKNPVQGVQESKDFLVELALDCAGQLGAVYGVNVP